MHAAHAPSVPGTEPAPSERIAGLKGLALGLAVLVADVLVAVFLEATSVKLQALGMIGSLIAGYGAVQAILGPRFAFLRWLVGVPAGLALFIAALATFAPWVFDAL